MAPGKPKATKKAKPESAPAAIPDDQAFALYLAAGGRCSFCNRYLIENETTGDPVRIGEMAHIVGKSKGPRSPRGSDDLPTSERNLASNLILVCPTEHRTIDKTTGAAIWDKEDLRQVKREHEDRIHALTALGKDRGTTVVRVIGRVRGTPPSVGKTEVHEAIHAELRFAQFGLRPMGADVEVSLLDIDEEQPDYFARTEELLARRIGRDLAEDIAAGDVRHLSIFGFARIPALIQLGHYLDDKWPAEIYQYHRDPGTWAWDPTVDPVQFSVVRIAGDEGANNVTLVCSVSGTVNRDHIPDACRSGAIYELTPHGIDPGVDLFRSRETLSTFSATYGSFLATVERDHPAATHIDVIPAIGLAAAIELGRRRTRAAHPVLRVWDQRPTRDGYDLAAEVG